jgi:putative transposase
MIYPVVRELAADRVPVALACRVLGVSTSGYYDWRNRPASPRQQSDLQLVEVIRNIHDRSRQTYGSPRVHAELRLGEGIRVGRKRVERLMRQHGIVGVHRRRSAGRTRSDSAASAASCAADLVHRRFVADRPDALWVSDITQHRTEQGWVYCAVVLDTFSRRVVGWSIADHLRTELLVDALEMACLRRKPAAQMGAAVFHSDHGSQYTSWAFGQRLRRAGLLGSMGSIGDCFDNALAESFFSSMQIELLDRQRWRTRQELANAIFEWIEAFYNPVRRHSGLDYLSPVDYERAHTPAAPAA